MVILIDGDGCPDLPEIKKVAKYYSVEIIVFVDYAHLLQDDYFKVIFCEVGFDSVDRAIVARCKKGDLVITQDYGLASLVLLKDAYVLHPSGNIIDNENIEQLLMNRYLGIKQRRARKHCKGPSKRTNDVQNYFLKQLEKLIECRDI